MRSLVSHPEDIAGALLGTASTAFTSAFNTRASPPPAQVEQSDVSVGDSEGFGVSAVFVGEAREAAVIAQ
jgi:hypothetical protein